MCECRSAAVTVDAPRPSEHQGSACALQATLGTGLPRPAGLAPRCHVPAGRPPVYFHPSQHACRARMLRALPSHGPGPLGHVLVSSHLTGGIAGSQAHSSASASTLGPRINHSPALPRVAPHDHSTLRPASPRGSAPIRRDRELGHVQDSVAMCQDLVKCIGQSGLTLLIKDSSRADIGGCSTA